MNHDRPPLPALHMERFPDLRTRPLGPQRLRFPSWKDLADEEAWVREGVRTGAFRGEHISADLTRVVGDFLRPPGDPEHVPFSMFYPNHAIVLPSVLQYWSEAERIMIERGGDPAIAQQGSLTMVQEALRRTIWEHYGRRVFVLDPLTSSPGSRRGIPGSG